MLVFVYTRSATQTVTGVTYGGVAMTAVAGGVAVDTAGEPGRVDTFFLGTSIPTGARSVVVSRTNNATVMYASAATQTALTDTEIYAPGIVLLQEDGTYAVQSVTDGSPGTNSVRYAGGYSGGANVLAAGAGSTVLNSIDFGAYTATTARETTAGQGARNVGFTYGTSDDRAAVHLAVREPPLPVNCTSQATGNWGTAGTWTTCRGGIPLAGDTVTITSTRNVTLNVNTPTLNDVTINGGGTLTNTGASTLSMSGNFSNSGTYNGTGSGAVTIGGNLSSSGSYTGGSGAVSLAGNFSFTAGTFTSGSGTWTFNGSSSQSITGTTTFTRLEVNNAGGITLNNSVTVDTLLTLTSGNITTGSSALITSANCPGSISRTSGHIVGNLQLRFASGIQTCTFPVGSGTAYAPITVTTPSGSAGGYLTGSTTGNEHPDIAASGIDSTLDANRYWTLGAGTDTIVAGTYDITFNFIAGDLDMAATPGNFIIGQVVGTTWTLPTSITATSTSTRSTNIIITGASFNTANSFVIGERVFVCSLPSTLPPGVASWPAGMSCYCDNFSRASLNPSTIFGGNFQVSTSSGTFGLPRIVNPGYLQMTDNTGNVATVATVPGTFPAVGNLITVEFRDYAYNGGGADGVALTLSDASVTPVAGAFGGSLGYAQKTTPSNIPGFAGGWVGIGLDEWGNFSAATEGRSGGPGQRADSVAIRGSGVGFAAGQYPYMAGTTSLTPGVDNAGSTTPSYGHLYRFMVDARGYTWNGTTGTKTTTVAVERDTTGTGSSYSTLVAPFDAFVANASQANVPANWVLSFTGSTGGSTNIHELSGLKVCAQTILPPAGYSILVNNYTPTTCPTDPRPTVTVKPLDPNGNVVTTYTNTVTLSAKLLGGANPAGTVTWTMITGGGVFTPSGATATYHYVTADNGVASFSLDDNTQEDLYITVTETPGTLQSTLGTPVQFSSGVASFVVAVPDALGTGVVAGRAHLMSITRNKSTCGGGTDTTYTGSKTLDGWYAPAAGDHPTGALAPQVCATNGSNTCLPATGACQTLSIAPPTVDPNSNNMPALTFTNGAANFCLATSDVGKYSVNLRDDSVATGTPAVTGASSNLTARPFAVVVANVAQGATGNPADNTSGGGIFTSAGTSFSAAVGGYLWSSNGSSNQGHGDTNGDGVPDALAVASEVFTGGIATHYADTVTLAADTSLAGNFAPTAPPATQGSLSGGSVTVADGIGSASTLSYNEVGTFTLTAAPATTYLNSAGVDLNTRVAIFAGPSNARTPLVGRFIPHHFDLTGGTLVNRSDVNAGAGCAPASVFTYMGEPMRVGFTLTAKNSGGSTTQNYAGSYAKFTNGIANWTGDSGNDRLGLWMVGQGYAVSPGTCSVVFSNATPSVTSYSCTGVGNPASINRAAGPRITVSPSPAISWAGGVGTFSADAVLQRADSPDGAYNTINTGVAPVDAEGVAVQTSALNLDANNDTVNERVSLGTTQSRFGILKLDSAYGSELLPIKVPVHAQYFTGAPGTTVLFQDNTPDNCTSIPASSLVLGNWKGALTSGNLGPGHLPGTATALTGGVGTLTVTKPSSSVIGSVDLAINLGATAFDANCIGAGMTATGSNMPWLRGNWCGGTFVKDPNARLTFGSARSPFIYLREMY